MIYNKKRYKQLLLLSEDLNYKGKTLFEENRKKYIELMEYQKVIEEEIFWNNKQKFILIMEDFLYGVINFTEFETSFTLLYYKTREKFNTFKTDLKEIENFQPSTRLNRCSNYVIAIFREFEAVKDEYCTEKDLQNYVEKVYLKFQKFK